MHEILKLRLFTAQNLGSIVGYTTSCMYDYAVQVKSIQLPLKAISWKTNLGTGHERLAKTDEAA